MSEQLLPCPFCGGKTKLDHPFHQGLQPVTFVLCDDCGACVSFRPNLIGKKTVEAWNKRALP